MGYRPDRKKMHLLKDRILLFFFAGCLLITALPADLPAAEGKAALQETRPRLKIGLVLSGGGARGAAHAGVMEVLDELRVPVDFIVGTSMGSIVGGLYATGTSPEEIGKLAAQIDWNGIFTEKIPRKKVFFRRKDERKNYLASIRIDAQKGLVIPSGLISGRKLNLTLRTLTLGACDDFDRFPIPFRAVATDVETGEMVVLAKGDLTKALSASMAIPAVFSPVEIDGRLLIDGGVSRNLPIDVARQMGADVVIAVNIGTPLYKKDKLGNFLSITDQTTGFLTNRNVSEQIKALKPGDILITPDMKDITTASFTRMTEAIQIGKDAARAAGTDLSRYALSDSEYRAFRQDQLKRSRRPERIDFTEVKQKEILKADIISGYVRQAVEKASGRLPRTDSLTQAVFEVSDRADLEKIDFSLVERNGKQGILLDAKAREHLQHNIDIGLQLSDDFKGGSSYDVLLRYTLKHIDSLDAEWKNEVQFGEKRSFFTEFYQPLESSAWRFFAAPYLKFEATPFYLYDESSRTAEYEQREFTGGGDLGIQLAEFGEVRAGLLKGTTSISLETGDSTLSETRFHDGAYKISLLIDQLDNLGFPQNGVLLRSSFLANRTGLGATDNFNVVRAVAAKPFTFGRNTVILRGKWESLLNHTDDLNSYFFLGGFLDMSGLAPRQLYGHQLVLAECIYTFRILNEKVFGNDLFAGISYETGNVWQERSEMSSQDLLRAGSIFIGADSIIGPVYLGFGHAEGGYSAAYFSIGFFY